MNIIKQLRGRNASNIIKGIALFLVCMLVGVWMSSFQIESKEMNPKNGNYQKH